MRNLKSGLQESRAPSTRVDLADLHAIRPTAFAPKDSADPRNIFARPLYAAPELHSSGTRPASTAGLEVPSRVGTTLRYRDGRITDLAGNPITEAP